MLNPSSLSPIVLGYAQLETFNVNMFNNLKNVGVRVLDYAQLKTFNINMLNNLKNINLNVMCDY